MKTAYKEAMEPPSGALLATTADTLETPTLSTNTSDREAYTLHSRRLLFQSQTLSLTSTEH